jgi:class 3 adenylate cyclase/tetratricopeptide (TPR) repeat protein
MRRGSLAAVFQDEQTMPLQAKLARHAADERLKAVKAYFNNGEFFRAHDLAMAAARRFPGDMRFAHRAVLSLANAGATELALKTFDELGLAAQTNTDIGSLFGRLHKDLAFAEPDPGKRRALFGAARAIYEDVYARAVGEGDAEAYYPAINAATLALLAGDSEAAGALAGAVLTLLRARMEALDHANAADRYWILATELEAYLVMGDVDAARALIGPVIAASGDDHAGLASTKRQLDRIVRAKGLDPALLEAFEPPIIIHYVGHMIAPPGQPGRFPAALEPVIQGRIEEALDGVRIGADILFAESLIARGVALNVVLPFAIDDFREQSVLPAGKGWARRFRKCLGAARTVRYATEDRYLGDDHLFAYCSGLAMGLGRLYARHLGAPVRQLAVWDGVSTGGIAGTSADIQTWQSAGLTQTIIPCGVEAVPKAVSPHDRPAAGLGRRDTRAMLFGDIHGFSKLKDAELPLFTELVMGALARVTRDFGGDIAFINTWGDGVFAVFPDAGRAAACALEMQRAMAGLDLAAAGLPPHLGLRLGGHLGPIYELTDPITGRPNYYGAHVSRAARIEPITPEGCIYVTETFAAVLALHNAGQFSCDYVGYTKMAKKYGRLRMFLLRTARDGEGPAVLGDIERAPN